MSDAAKLVLDVLMGTTPAVVRLMRPDDAIPPEFEAGFDQLGALDTSWIWVSELQGAITGILIASPCHGVALIWKLALRPNEPVSVLFKLLRAFLKDIRQRGMRGYMTWVDPNVKTQAKLKRIIERAGGKSAVGTLELIAAPLAREGI